MDKNLKGLKPENQIIDNTNISDENDIINFLKEKQSVKINDTWSKVDKTTKILKINEFIDDIFRKEQLLNDFQCDKCKGYLMEQIDKKRINKNKDVVYKDEQILSIQNFTYNKVTNKPNITCEKRASTLRLPDLKKINRKHNKTKQNSGCDESAIKKIKIKEEIGVKKEEGNNKLN